MSSLAATKGSSKESLHSPDLEKSIIKQHKYATLMHGVLSTAYKKKTLDPEGLALVKDTGKRWYAEIKRLHTDLKGGKVQFVPHQNALLIQNSKRKNRQKGGGYWDTANLMDPAIQKEAVDYANKVKDNSIALRNHAANLEKFFMSQLGYLGKIVESNISNRTKIDTLNKEVGTLKQSNTQLTAEKDTLTQQVSQLTLERDGLVEQLKQMTANYNDSQQKYAELQQEIARLQENLLTTQQAHDQLSNLSQGEKAELQRQITELEGKLNVAEQNHNAAEQRLQQLTEAKNKVDTQIHDLQTEYDAATKALNTQEGSIAAHQDVIQNQQMALSQLQAQLANAQQNEAAILQQLGDAQAMSNSSKDNVDALQQSLAERGSNEEKIQSELDFNKTQLAELQKNLDASRERTTTLESELASKEQILQQLQAKIAEQDGTINTLTQDNQNLTNELNTVKANLATKDEEIANLQAELQGKNAELDRINQQLRDDATEYSNLQKLYEESKEALAQRSILTVPEEQALRQQVQEIQADLEQVKQARSQAEEKAQDDFDRRNGIETTAARLQMEHEKAIQEFNELLEKYNNLKSEFDALKGTSTIASGILRDINMYFDNVVPIPSSVYPNGKDYESMKEEMKKKIPKLSFAHDQFNKQLKRLVEAFNLLQQALGKSSGSQDLSNPLQSEVTRLQGEIATRESCSIGTRTKSSRGVGHQ
jgi:DNA repair exonuclease SbcCD ATPase subunit